MGRLIPVLVAVVVLAVVMTVIALAGRGNDTDPVGSAPGSGASKVPPDAGGGTSGSSGTGGLVPGSSGTASPPDAPSTEPGPDDPQTRFTSVRAVDGGSALVVTFWGGVDTCFRYAVRADETAQEVALSLSEERRGDGPCIELAQEHKRTVQLAELLADRPVVDAATGEVVLAARG